MRGAALVGLVLATLDAFAACYLLVNGGAQAEGGDGYSTVAASALAALAVVGGGLLVWGLRSGGAGATIAGVAVAGLPFLGLIAFRGTEGFSRVVQRAKQSRFSAFDDPKVQRLATAITRDDTATVRAVLAAGGVDFRARNAYDKTILTFAVDRVADFATPASVEGVRMLVAAGALVSAKEAPPGGVAGNDAESLIVRVLDPGAWNVAVLDTLLGGGLDPNMATSTGIPFFYRSHVRRETLEVLAKHGADFTRENTNDERLRGVSVATWRALDGRWDLVLWYLEHGVSPDYGSADFNLRQVVRDAEERSAGDADFARVKARLAAMPAPAH